MKLGGSNYDKYPSVAVPKEHDKSFCGWGAIAEELNSALSGVSDERKCLVVECYNGIIDAEVCAALKSGVESVLFVDTKTLMLPSYKINALLSEDITDDEIFGYITRYDIDCYFDTTKIINLHGEIAAIEERAD